MKNWGGVLTPTPGHPISHTTRKGVPHKTLHPERMERQRSGTQSPSWIWDKAQAIHNHREEHLPSRRPPQQGTQAPSPWLPPRARGRLGESIQEDRSQQGMDRPWVSHPGKVAACQMVLSEPSSWYPFPCRVPTPSVWAGPSDFLLMARLWQK